MSASRVPPIVTLTTDFGLLDHYVGTMKGVLLTRCPDAQLVDISHEIQPFSIYSGAYAIDQAAPYFPAGTVHVVVVDPGVGTSRKAVLIQALDQYFVAPDNGVLSLVIGRDDSPKVREITNSALWLELPSSTFHGRDIFAPVAASIASGAARMKDVGPVLERIELLPDLEPEQIEHGTWRGRLLSIDRFGNVITNFKASEFRSISSGPFFIRCGNHEITEFRATFENAPQNRCFAYFGSSGYVELGMKQQSAAVFLQASSADSLTLQVLTMR
ncbi:MAG: SAM-dependent chlorinase/fluorinase [Acidobacteriaceae bacterium]|nr:SAM-dependent chlorinase/fluorinase [Acidobacteriaceae bacterium]MBV9766110.1 SAM-dependent chlorinase/fluorinase [Acidobacteriaceae bacterium]